MFSELCSLGGPWIIRLSFLFLTSKAISRFSNESDRVFWSSKATSSSDFLLFHSTSSSFWNLVSAVIESSFVETWALAVGILSSFSLISFLNYSKDDLVTTDIVKFQL